MKVSDLHHCEHCGLDLYIEKDLEDHVEKYHEGYAENGCKECDQKFKNTTELKDHMKIAHHYTCVVCGLYFHGNRFTEAMKNLVVLERKLSRKTKVK